MVVALRRASPQQPRERRFQTAQSCERASCLRSTAGFPPRVPMNDTSATLRTAIRLARASGLEEEPGPPLGLIDPSFEQTRAGHVIMLVA
jgi:hypothetical protein